MYDTRHILLQSAVDLLVAHNVHDESRQVIPEIPEEMYSGGRHRSTSFLISPSRLSRPQSMRDDGESGGSTRSPSTDSQFLPCTPGSPLNISTLHEILFVGVVIMAQFMGLAGLSQSIAPMRIIAATMHTTTPGEEAWFSAAFSFTVGTFIHISGRMGDIIGHIRVFVFGYFFLGCWSAFAGFSAYIEKQIFFGVCGAFQGIGAALLAPSALALLGRAYAPGMKKNIVFSLFGAMTPWGFVMGALFSSLFAQLTWWPWAYWSYGIAAWGLAAFSLLLVPKTLAYDAQSSSGEGKPGMDWTGFCTWCIWSCPGQCCMKQWPTLWRESTHCLRSIAHWDALPHRLGVGRGTSNITHPVYLSHD